MIKKSFILSGLLLALYISYRPWAWVRAQSAVQRVDPDAQTVLIRCGVTDKVGNTWSGTLEADSSGAEALSLRGYHFQPPDDITGVRFSFATRPWVTTFQQVDLSPGRPGPRAVFPNGVYATVKGPSSARFRLALDGAAHSFSLADLAGGKIVSFENGNVELQLVPAGQELSAAEGQADFPAIASGPSGKVAAAWQEFDRDRDRIVIREFDGGAWLAPETFEMPETRDVFRSAAAYDGSGALHLIWSAQMDGNWDLYERRKTAQGWSAVERLTTAAGSDFHHKLVADTAGNLWLAWQAFRGSQSDIYLRRFADSRWGRETQVSTSWADDWEPAVAAAPDGTIWVGWDGYDRGHRESRSYRSSASHAEGFFTPPEVVYA